MPSDLHDCPRSNRSDPSDGSEHPLSRRSFLKAATVGAASLAANFPAAASHTAAPPVTHGLIDCNINLSRWPFRRLPLDDTAKLVAKLKSQHVTQAWSASFDALLHKDLASANRRLVEECRRHGQWTEHSRKTRPFLIPFGTVDPALPDWQEELRRCHEQYGMPGIRLFPNYHGYKLDDPRFAQLAAAAASDDLILQIALSMEDERMQYPLMRVPNVDPAPLQSLLEQQPRLKIVLLNWFRVAKSELLKALAATRRAWFDIAMVEGVGGISNILEYIPSDRVLFGSHVPFYYFESAALKLQESPLRADQLRQISSANASLLLH